MSITKYIQKNISNCYIILLCAVVLIISTKGITDEATIASNGDMPKYLMNGAYFYDLLRDLPITNPLMHASLYFAKYPALSLGHHPLLLGIAEVPFYSIFGISVFSGRVTIVFFVLLAATSWFLLVRSIYNEKVAFLSSLLFVTTPFIAEYSRIVMSEMPALALVIVATYLFYQYCESDKKKYVIASAISLSLSVYGKHTVIFIIPVLLCYLLFKKGIRRLIYKELLISYIIVLIITLPLVPITLKFAQSNVGWVAQSSLGGRLSISNLTFYLKALYQYHLTLPVLILSLISIFVAIYKRDKRVIIFLLWIIGCYLLLTSLGIQKNPRYAMYWIPAFCLFPAILISSFQHRLWKIFISTTLFVIIGYQFAVVVLTNPEYTNGYEQAAKYILENRKGESVLYSEVKDTGYFIFFVRKHNPEQDLVVLRADKILATSKMDRVVEERIANREDIYKILKNYGVGYVVIEDMETGSRALEWLREEVKSSKFILRKEITLRSNRVDVNNIPLTIYEYREYTPPREDVKLHMNIPLMGDSIEIDFKDLLQKD